jgi:hypothetical protein
MNPDLSASSTWLPALPAPAEARQTPAACGSAGASGRRSPPGAVQRAAGEGAGVAGQSHDDDGGGGGAW